MDPRVVSGACGEAEVGGRERGRVVGVGNTQVAKSGQTFWFSNPGPSLPVARVPDVLSKAPSLGRLRDTGSPSKSAWPPPSGAAHGGSGSLASGSCTTLARAPRPHVPPWHGPSFGDLAPTSLEAAGKAHGQDRTPPGETPSRPRAPTAARGTRSTATASSLVGSLHLCWLWSGPACGSVL